MVLPVALSSSRDLSDLHELAEQIRPVVLARQAVLPVCGPLEQLIPDGGLMRGSTIAVGGVGATSLALQLITAASKNGSWVAVVGLSDLAPVAVLEAGLDAERVAFIDPGGSGRGVDVVAALVGAIDIVVLDSRLSLRDSDTRRLGSRLRERGSILVVVSPGDEPTSQWSSDLVFTVRDSRWEGLGCGHGHLRSRRVRVGVGGRGRASRNMQHELLLPAADGHGATGECEDGGGTVVAFSR
ncbi:MAG: hypothetical protein JHC63_09630 [Acidimicrobiia bacterium]|nr:hypothetical protein [Acidimicrobiia bacterium]